MLLLLYLRRLRLIHILLQFHQLCQVSGSLINKLYKPLVFTVYLYEDYAFNIFELCFDTVFLNNSLEAHLEFDFLFLTTGHVKSHK